MVRKDINVKHKSSQLKGSGSKTCASLGGTKQSLNILIGVNSKRLPRHQKKVTRNDMLYVFARYEAISNRYNTKKITKGTHSKLCHEIVPLAIWHRTPKIKFLPYFNLNSIY
jgi:hypothetical protein